MRLPLLPLLTAFLSIFGYLMTKIGSSLAIVRYSRHQRDLAVGSRSTLRHGKRREVLFGPVLAGHMPTISTGLSLFVRFRSAPYASERRSVYDPATVCESGLHIPDDMAPSGAK